MPIRRAVEIRCAHGCKLRIAGMERPGGDVRRETTRTELNLLFLAGKSCARGVQ